VSKKTTPAQWRKNWRDFQTAAFLAVIRKGRFDKGLWILEKSHNFPLALLRDWIILNMEMRQVDAMG
jgi:hypothetical protein